MPERDGGDTRAGDGLPLDQLRDAVTDLMAAVAERGVTMVSEKVEDLTARLTDYAEHGGPSLRAALTGGKALAEGKSPVKAALEAGLAGAKEKVKQALGAGAGGGGGMKVKVTNIVEQLDVGVPVRVAYDQWTQFQDFPSFTKKVNSVEQVSEEKVTWKAQVFLSHRSWEATIIEQIPDTRIVWRSQGAKGHVDGTVTFHELTPDLTRILLVLEYHPQGLFERTGNLWRAQGRRARLELKHFARHVMTRTILEQDDLEGWRGEIRDSEVVRSHEDALAEEEESRDERERDEGSDYASQDEADDYEDYDDEDEGEDREHDQNEDGDPDEERHSIRRERIPVRRRRR
jgi:uncharacterized membrane protein